MNDIFIPADILLPQNVDMSAFSVVACDQYTSEPEYWEAVKKRVGDRPSALNMVFPEIYLKSGDFEKTIDNINLYMKKYLEEKIFAEHKNSFVYVERRLKNSKVRRGVVGMIDLEMYDYTVGSQTPVRATEGTVLDRIPPRVKIRENAPIELPHVMLLIDDVKKAVIEGISDKKDSLQKLYSFEMMQDSGYIEGYLLDVEAIGHVMNGIRELAEVSAFCSRYDVSDKELLLFAVGDGNHSLATAKKCYMNLKEEIGCEKAMQSKARYALAELVNLHDESLEFEAIHRVVFDVAPYEVMKALDEKYRLSDSYISGSQSIDVVIGDKQKTIYIINPTLNLPVGSLQAFIDEYMEENGGEVDYIHGDDVVKKLCRENPNSIGFILPCMDKNDLFKTVILDGALPRKTFSMGEACDKRFYLEARKICE